MQTNKIFRVKKTKQLNTLIHRARERFSNESEIRWRREKFEPKLSKHIIYSDLNHRKDHFASGQKVIKSKNDNN